MFDGIQNEQDNFRFSLFVSAGLGGDTAAYKYLLLDCFVGSIYCFRVSHKISALLEKFG